jgi:glycosyltransferase involved in cell wall biosynthesis
VELIDLNILLVCKRHYTNKDLISDRFGRLFHFPKVWREKGNQVTVLAADYLSFSNSTHEIAGVTFHSLGFPSLGFDFLHRINAIARTRKYDLVIGSCDSHFGYIALKLAKKLGIPFVFDLYHHYADFGTNRIPGMKAMYYSSLANANLVVCDSKPLKEKIQPFNNNTHIAPQGTDPSIFKSLPREQCIRELCLDPARKYIGYTGTLDNRFDYDCLIQAMEKITGNDTSICLLIAGTNLSGYYLNRDFIHYLGELPQERIPVVINACEVMCIPYKLTDLASTCNPCKLSEYIACGLPIVASAISNVTDYLPVSRELCYVPGDAASLSESLLRQLATPVTETPSEELTWETIGSNYLDELYKLHEGNLRTRN